MIQAEYSELTLEIAGRDYKLKTLAQQRDGLQEAASLLNQKIFELKNRGRHLSNEQAAILAALHLSYDLLTEREKRGTTDVHFLRLEQLYPFPADALAELLEPYRHCRLVWCQEEPRNMGAWSFVSEFITEVAEDLGFEHPAPRYAGRMTAASPATGRAKVHAAEQQALVWDALEIGRAALRRTAARRAVVDPPAR